MRMCGRLAVVIGVVCGGAAVWWFASRSGSGIESADPDAALAQRSSFGAAENVATRPVNGARGGAPLSASAFEDAEGRLPTTPPSPPRPGTERRPVEVVFPDGVPLAGMRAWPAPAADGAENWSRFTEDGTDAVLLDERGRAYVDVPTGATFRLAGVYLPDRRFDASNLFITNPVETSAGVDRGVVSSSAVRIHVVDERGAAYGGLAITATGLQSGGDLGSLTSLTDSRGMIVFRNWRGASVECRLADAATIAAASPVDEAKSSPPGGERTHVITSATGDVGRRFIEKAFESARDGPGDSPYAFHTDVYEVLANGSATFVVRALPRLLGRVVDAAGDPVSVATCKLRARCDDGRIRTVAQTKADREGKFSLAVPFDGRVLARDGAPFLCVTAQWLEEDDEQYAQAVVDGAVVGERDLGTLRPDRRKVLLRVVDATGTPVEGFAVLVSEGRSSTSLATDPLPDGAVALSAPPDGFDLRIEKKGFLPAPAPSPYLGDDRTGPPPELRVVLLRPPRLSVRIPEHVRGGQLVFDDSEEEWTDMPSIPPPSTDGAPRIVTFAVPSGEPVDVGVEDLRIVAPGGRAPSVAAWLRCEPFAAEEHRTVDFPCASAARMFEIAATDADGMPVAGARCVVKQGDTEAAFRLDDEGRGRCAVAPGSVCTVSVQTGLLRAERAVEPRETSVQLQFPPSREVRPPDGRWTATAGAAWWDPALRDDAGDDEEIVVLAPRDAIVRFTSEEVDAVPPMTDAPPGAERPPQSGVLAIVVPGRLVFGHLRVVVEGPVPRRLRWRQRPSVEPYRPPPMVVPAGRYRVTAYRCDEWDAHDRGRRLGTQIVDVVEGKTTECRF